MSENYGITRDDYKSKWKSPRSQFMREQPLKRKQQSGQPTSDVLCVAMGMSQFIIMRMRDPLFSGTMFPRLAPGAAKHLFASR